MIPFSVADISLTCQKWFTDILSVIFIICQLFGLLIKEIKSVSKKITKKELVYNQIRNAIISGELIPGEIFNEAEIALRFSSGKTPTREALLLLVHDRFLESLPRIGYQITKPTLQDVLELLYLRRILEGEAMLLAFNNITSEIINQLENNNKQEESLLINRNEVNKTEAAALNREFHLTISSLSGNTRLTNMIRKLLDDMERLLVSDPYVADPNQHKEIIKALIDGNRNQAFNAMKRHIEETRKRILNRY